MLFELFHSFMWDTLTVFTHSWGLSQFLFYTDYQDFFTVILHHTPELSLALVEYYSHYIETRIFSQSPAVIGDFFSDNLSLTLGEFLETLMGSFL
jgi:hypothetical protein